MLDLFAAGHHQTTKDPTAIKRNPTKKWIKTQLWGILHADCAMALLICHPLQALCNEIGDWLSNMNWISVRSLAGPFLPFKPASVLIICSPRSPLPFNLIPFKFLCVSDVFCGLFFSKLKREFWLFGKHISNISFLMIVEPYPFSWTLFSSTSTKHIRQR